MYVFFAFFDAEQFSEMEKDDVDEPARLAESGATNMSWSNNWQSESREKYLSYTISFV